PCSSSLAHDQPNMFTAYGGDIFYWQFEPGSTQYWQLRSANGGVGQFRWFETTGSFPHLEGVGNALLFSWSNYLTRIDIPTLTWAFVGIFNGLGPVAALGGTGFFTAYDPAHRDYGLWRTDGTFAGTQVVVNTPVPPVYSPWAPDSVAVVNGELFFTVAAGRALWVSDGTAPGTRRFESARLRLPLSGLSADLQDERLVFFADDELWSTDSAFHASQIHGFQYRPGSAELRALTAVNGTVVFGAREDRWAEHRLWRSDGTQSGTKVLSSSVGVLEDAALYHGGLVFRNGTRVWTTDGTTIRTYPLLADFTVDSLSVVGIRLFFSGFSASQGFEPWLAYPTLDGWPRILKDVAPGTESSEPRQFTLTGSMFYFSAHTPGEGTEVWATDGTTDYGTRLLTDICPGPCSSDPHFVATLNGSLFFTIAGSPNLLSITPGQPGFLDFHSPGQSSLDPVVV